MDYSTMTDFALPVTDARTTGAGPLEAAVERWAAERPSATACSAPDGVLDFAGLAGRTAAIAGALAAAGVGPGRTVALTTGRSRLAVASLLAVWRLGATAVPLDERHPAARIAEVLAGAGVDLVLGHRPPGAPADLPVLDPEHAAGGPFVAAEGELAYIIHTSGSAGRPKGVEITYAGLGTLLEALSGIHLGAGGLGINPLSPAFDGWLWCVLLHLLNGVGTAILDLVDDGEHVDLAGRIAAVAPRTASLTPSLLASCADALAGAEVVVVAGERCPRGLLDLLLTRHRVLNVYGPTETTIAATCADSARGDDVTTIGRPLPGYRARVLDADLRPVPAGTPGELCLGGTALARGYRGDPDLTARRFVTVAGERLFRTGDQVLARPDGQLEFLGRLDAQVKVRGFRIELGEIERIVEQLPAVTAATAFVRTAGDTLGLAAVLGDGHDVTAGALLVREHCRTFLPEHMLPSTVDFVPALPYTDRGKVDRDALALAADAARTAGRPPATDREHEVCAVFSDVLDHPVTDVTADFFELGGHSLLAARVVAALRKRTGLRASIPLLLGHPNPAELARELDRLAAVSA
jgi:amino acid adenylation domain-containing protein